jgi:hypothetical protein
MSEPLLADGDGARQQSVKRGIEETSAKCLGNGITIVEGGSDFGLEFIHVAESQEAVDSVHGVAAVGPYLVAECPEQLNKNWAKYVTSEPLTVE